MFHFFEKMNKGHLKEANTNYLKWSEPARLSFY